MGCGAGAQRYRADVAPQEPAGDAAPKQPEPDAKQTAAAADAEPAEAAEDWLSGALTRLDQELGPLPRVCILGGTAFHNPDTEVLVQALAKEMAADCGDRATVMTGGMPGIQRAFALSCGDGSCVRNLLPEGGTSDYGVGTDVFAGKDLEQRKEVFGLIGDIYVTFEGGPGVAQEARAAHERSACVIPFIRTGGASGGMFDFPAEALQKPSFASDEQWALLQDKEAPMAEVAAAAAAIVRQRVDEYAAAQPALPHFAQISFKTPEEQADLHDKFKKAVGKALFNDTNENGEKGLEYGSFQQMLKRLDPEATNQEVENLYLELDRNGDGHIDYGEFSQWLESGPEGSIRSAMLKAFGTEKDMVKAAFRVFDRDGDGTVSQGELVNVMIKLCGAKESAENLAQTCFGAMDTDGDGVIDFDEFLDSGKVDYEELFSLMFGKALSETRAPPAQ